jgi:hypothetical protein
MLRPYFSTEYYRKCCHASFRAGGNPAFALIVDSSFRWNEAVLERNGLLRRCASRNDFQTWFGQTGTSAAQMLWVDSSFRWNEAM